MKSIIEFGNKQYHVYLNEPLDLSIPMESGKNNPNAFGLPTPLFEPFKAGSFIGSVAQGGPVNCENLFLNPHGNGTHTECYGHISKEKYTIYEALKQYFFLAQVISVPMHTINHDQVVIWDDLATVIKPDVEAVVLRTLPNTAHKLTAHYSGNNPGYFTPEVCLNLCKMGVKHLIIDLPSVDREEDGGALAAHHAFWNYPNAPRKDATITEMAFIADSIADGLYVLNLQIASIKSDASPSKPVLYKTHVL